MRNLLQDSGIKMKSSWIDYVAFKAVTYAVSNHDKKAWRWLYRTLNDLVLDSGGSPQLQDPGVKALFLAIGYDVASDLGQLDKLTSCLGQWGANRKKGPGQYDMSPISDLRKICDEHGWGAVDALMETLYDITVSRVFLEPRAIIEPSDLGVDGDQCYALSLTLRARYGETEAYYTMDDKWRVLASRPELLSPHIVRLVDDHVSNQMNEARKIEAMRTDTLAAAAMPILLEITKNGSTVASMRVGMRTDSPGVEIMWSTAKLLVNDQALMESLVAIAPVKDAYRLKGQFLEEAMGL
jgi:hypothetical protein